MSTTTSYDISFAPSAIRETATVEPDAVPVPDFDLDDATATFFGSDAYRRDTDHLFDAAQSARTEIMSIAQQIASERSGI